MSDYYTILGVPKTASSEEVKQAYRKLAHQHHPDKKGGDEKKFKEINEAYQVLSNQEKRAQYDQYGRVFEGGAGSAGQGSGFGGFDFGSFGGQAGGGFDFNGLNFEDLFGSFGFGQGGSRKKPKNKGQDMEIELLIDLKDTLKEVAKKISLSKMVKCSRCEGNGAEAGAKIKECFSCKGTGWVQQMKKMGPITFSQDAVCPECKGEGKIPEKPCNVCRGEGRLRQNEEITVVIPAGVDNGQVLRIDGAGEAGKRGAMAGNLYIKIALKPHPLFERKGDDLLGAFPISFSLAALGGEVDIETLEGKHISLKVPEGTPSGKIFRIGGKGVPRFNGWSRGDLFVELVIDTPKKLNKKQKELLNELRREGL